jgi:hypothetical protein
MCDLLCVRISGLILNGICERSDPIMMHDDVRNLATSVRPETIRKTLNFLDLLYMLSQA